MKGTELGFFTVGSKMVDIMGYGRPGNWWVRFQLPQKIPSGMQCRDHLYIEDPIIWVDAFEVGRKAPQDSFGGYHSSVSTMGCVSHRLLTKSSVWHTPGEKSEFEVLGHLKQFRCEDPGVSSVICCVEANECSTFDTSPQTHLHWIVLGSRVDYCKSEALLFYNELRIYGRTQTV